MFTVASNPATPKDDIVASIIAGVPHEFKESLSSFSSENPLIWLAAIVLFLCCPTFVWAYKDRS